MRHLALLALLPACALDTSHHVNVAPSAYDQLPAIVSAAEQLNVMAGAELYTVVAVDSGAARDGEIVVRGGAPQGTLVASTERTRRGVVIVLSEGLGAIDVAHELGHAAGLSHVATPGNLMCERGRCVGWDLTPGQLEQLR